MTRVTFGCCVGSWERFTRNVVPFADKRPVIALSGQTSITAAYNSIIDSLVPQPQRDFDMLILQHDDLEIVDPHAIEKFAEVLQDPEVAIVGVAGGAAFNGLAWWTANPIGHVLADTGMVDFKTHSGEVDLLEGCILALSYWAVRNLYFDVRPGFHGYDSDISMLAHSAGKKTVVANVDVHHHTSLGFDNEASHKDWLEADQEFRERWL